MKKICLVVLFLAVISYSLSEKFNKNKNTKPATGEFHRAHDYPDIVESVQSDLPEVPQIKIRMVNADEDDDDDPDATITLDPEDNESEEEDDDDDDEDDLPVKKRKLPKAKSEDIHSFL